MDKDNLIVITGASRGLGFEFARQYSADGYRVLGLCRQEKDRAALQALGAEAACLDMQDHAAIRAFAKDLGSAKIGLLINNAGMNPGHWPLGEIDYGNWQKAFHINVIAPLQCAEALFPLMPQGAAIVNIGSAQGSISRNKDGGRYLYRATKAALHAITKSLAIDLAARGVMAVALHPGWVKTDMGGQAADIDVDTSISGMCKVIAGLNSDASGRLYNYDGAEIPW